MNGGLIDFKTMPQSFAHSLEGRSQYDWEPLEDHLRRVADGNGTLPGAADFAEIFGAKEWGRLAGLWHDLGKYSAEFQAYLRSANGLEAHLESAPGRVDHSTAGAQHAASRFAGTIGRLLAYCIAGHHSGLPDNVDGQGGISGLSGRLSKKIPDWSAAPAAILNQPRPPKPPLDWDADKRIWAFQAAVFCRMLFSCLVDADYLATEAFMRPERTVERNRSIVAPSELLKFLDAHLSRLAASASDTTVNRARAGVLAQCRTKAGLPPGFFSLTVPTGGGKTLSSLAFALTHAAKFGLRRVIYAIPFTSIIEQNVDVFRQALNDAGPDVVLEHHSNLDPDKETYTARLAAENWDSALVVTTNVQLFESLFANKSSRCRKLHRIAHSVIILDECQTLPVTLLAPTLRMLEELCRNYGCTVVLCSATQPAIAKRPDFGIGLHNVREIVDDPLRLYVTLRRVEIEQLGNLDNGTVVERLRRHKQALCVVNTRAHAATLFTELSASSNAPESVFHLSASMCAAHRTDVLGRIRGLLNPDSPKPCVVISTQLIEAGVDIDFPVVYRAMTGLDSIAQAAGRCNREGRLSHSRVYVFDTDVDPPGDLRQRCQMGREVAGLYDDLLALDAIEHYFRLSYWTRSSEWDQQEILKLFGINGGMPHFQFREVAERYRMIEDIQQSVIVPYGERGRKLVDELRYLGEPPGRDFDRRAQRFVVGVYDRQLVQLCRNHGVTKHHDRYWVLENTLAYDEAIGLRADVLGFDAAQLCY